MERALAGAQRPQTNIGLVENKAQAWACPGLNFSKARQGLEEGLMAKEVTEVKQKKI